MNTRPRDPNKRQRKTVKINDGYPPVRIISPTGKLRLASAMKKEAQRRETYKSVVDASFWADYEPKHKKYGVYASPKMGSYAHNGITRYL